MKKQVILCGLMVAVFLLAVMPALAGKGLLLDIGIIDYPQSNFQLDGAIIARSVGLSTPNPSNMPAYYLTIKSRDDGRFTGFPGQDAQGRFYLYQLSDPMGRSHVIELVSYDPRMDKIEIWENNAPADDLLVGTFSLAPFLGTRGQCGDGVCAGENHATCPQDCPQFGLDLLCEGSVGDADSICDRDCVTIKGIFQDMNILEVDEDCVPAEISRTRCPNPENQDDRVQCAVPPVPAGVSPGAYSYLYVCEQDLIGGVPGPVKIKAVEMCPGPAACVDMEKEPAVCDIYPKIIPTQCTHGDVVKVNAETNYNYYGTGINPKEESGQFYFECPCGNALIHKSVTYSQGVPTDENGAVCCNQLDRIIGMPPPPPPPPPPDPTPTTTPTPTPTSTPTPTCFVEGTRVLMADGTTKPIESVKVGDYVQSYNLNNKKAVSGKVIKTFMHDTDEYIQINNIKTTSEHQFLVDGEWVTAAWIEAGDMVEMSDGSFTKVTRVQTIEAPVRVYNLEIAKYHNYLVDDGVVVHNAVVKKGVISTKIPTTTATQTATLSDVSMDIGFDWNGIT